MKEKKLYSSAIIPDELYVHRDADRKLKEVILRMSKPAYISVARQMGKTNLLIQTKRTLENKNNRYIYIDVTNKFDSSQECFRYIVNQIINSNEDIKEFQEAKEAISNSRIISSSSSTEEYQNEIREILKRFKGNIVVFLDEVDDLRKHNFSDEIFGQIRKTYFINETYPVLKRITYILSGVIDPEKLIKTKENSPFNIAIPIYLEDFNYPEFLELINKSTLIIENEISEYIYDWLKGNPRMSFEILSLIEDEYLRGQHITKEIVDKIINDFYLTNFKNPPIDHIRDLIKHNAEVRKALVRLKNNQVDELTDDVINKLYLYGIIATKTKKNKIKIKNKVIELSLSTEWLELIELETKGYYSLGRDKIKQGKDKEGIEYLKEYILNEPKGEYVHIAKYDIGKAYHQLGNHEASNQYLLEKPFSKKDSFDLYFKQISYVGINFHRLGNLEIALQYYDEIINDADDIILKITTYVKKGDLLIKSAITHDLSTIKQLYLEALDLIEQNHEIIKANQEWRTLLYYRLGLIHSQYNSPKQEIHKYMEKALEYAKTEDKPSIYLFIDSLLDKEFERKKDIYINLVDLIIINNIVFKKSNDIIRPFNELQLILILSNLFEFKLINEFDKLLKYALNKLYLNQLKESELIYKTAIFIMNNKKTAVVEKIFQRVLNFSDIDLKTKKNSHQVLGLIAFNKQDSLESINQLNQYIKIFHENNNFNEELKIIDFNAFINVIVFYRKKNNYLKSFEVASIIKKLFHTNLSSENKANSAVILFYIMDYYALIGDIHNSKVYGEQLLAIISEVKPVLNELSYVDKKGLEDIEKQTRSRLKGYKSVKPITPIKVDRKPGRNEYIKVKYKNGDEVTIKYKKAIDAIKKGECHLVE